MEVAERVEVQDVQDPDDALATLVRLVEEHWIEKARALAPEYAARWPEHPALQRFALVLEPPTLLPSRRAVPKRSLEAERNWLRHHAHEYPGCWIAVYGSDLVAAARSVREVLAALDDKPGGTGAVLFFQPEP